MYARYRYSLLEVTVYGGANVDSDLYLLSSKIRSRISNSEKDRGKRISGRLKDELIAKNYANKISEVIATAES
jgi:hypothetical protein